MMHAFGRFARGVSNAIGSPYAFAVALLVVIVWAVSGPFLGFSATWQLIINTLTTITTGLIVFVIQYAQNRDTKALHVKLDELLIAVQEANNEVAELEEKEEDVVAEVQEMHHQELTK